jgi:ActR/RegA family two-component response regulator
MALTAGKTVLLVDDSDTFGPTLALELTREGYEVSTARSVIEALQLLGEADRPTFVIADRVLDDVPIETDGLQELISAADGSYVLVYTNRDELQSEEEVSILQKGAFRVLDKHAVEEIVHNIKALTRELDELVGLKNELNSLTATRRKMTAALLGASVGFALIDRRYRSWYSNAIDESFDGGACWSGFCSRGLATGKCWGCTVPEVMNSGERLDRLFLSRLRDGSLKWLSVQSDPIRLDPNGSVAAVRLAVSEAQDSTVVNLTTECRLLKIARGFIQIGFGQVRLFRAKESGDAELVAAAACTDTPGAANSEYFETLLGGAKLVNFRECPYALQAFTSHTALLVRTLDPKVGPGPLAKRFGLEPPYFEIPIWGTDGRLCAWIDLDFGGIADTLKDSAILSLVKEETGYWLQESYGEEVRRALVIRPADETTQKRHQIIERARSGVVGAPSVDDAMKELRAAFQELLPGCRVTVRVRLGDLLEEDRRLSSGPRSIKLPERISLSNVSSLAARVVREERPLWIDNYPEYRRRARKVGEAEGFGEDETISSAHLPLIIANIVYGALSIDSPHVLDWRKQGLNKPIDILAGFAAILIRDITLDVALAHATMDRAAMTAYTATLSGDVFWRNWVQRQLFLAAAETSLLIKSATQASTDKEMVVQALRRVGEILEQARSGPPPNTTEASCSLELVLREVQKANEARLAVEVVPFGSIPLVRMPHLLVRGILEMLIQNALDAIVSQEEHSANARVTITIAARELHAELDVIDNGPGIPTDVAKSLFVGPVKSDRGAGMALLTARGAALSFGGDISMEESSEGARFKFRIPFA